MEMFKKRTMLKIDIFFFFTDIGLGVVGFSLVTGTLRKRYRGTHRPQFREHLHGRTLLLRIVRSRREQGDKWTAAII